MNVSVVANITVKIQSRTVEMSLDEAKQLYSELGKIVGDYTPPLMDLHRLDTAPMWRSQEG